MGQAISQERLARASGQETVTPGEVVWAKVDILTSHDPCTPGVASVFENEFGEQAKIWDAGHFILIPDHCFYSADP